MVTPQPWQWMCVLICTCFHTAFITISKNLKIDAEFMHKCFIYLQIQFYTHLSLYTALCVRVCVCWSHDEECLIRTRRKRRRRCRVSPKGERRSIRKDTPHCRHHRAHHLLQITHTWTDTLNPVVLHSKIHISNCSHAFNIIRDTEKVCNMHRNYLNKHKLTSVPLFTALFLAIAKVPLQWHVIDNRINK